MASREIQTDPPKDIDIEGGVREKVDPILVVVEGPVAFINAAVFDLPPYIVGLMSRAVRRSLLY